MENCYDLIVIGAGPGGYVAAKKAAKLGMKVALIDEGPIGGTCINRGCIPTKALLHSATLYRQMQQCELFGLKADHTGFDLQKIFEYKNEAVKEMREGLEAEFKELGVEIITAHATIMGHKRIRLNYEGTRESTIFGKKILIATGAKANLADIPGMDLPGVMTSDDLLASDASRYKSLLILGGGVIGLEAATIFNGLGADVTIIEISDRLLPNMDVEFSDALEQILISRGIKIHKESILEQVTKGEDEKLTCRYVNQGKTKEVTVEGVLVSVGRSANTEGLFGPDVHIKQKDGKIVVDEFYMSSIPGIYAVGDVTEGIQLAHVAAAEATYVVEKMNNLRQSVVISIVPSCLFTPISIVPSCLYTEPEIASVGLTEEEAKRKGVSVRCGKYTMEGNGQSIITKEEKGFMKVIFAADSDVLLGAQIMCSRATDMIGEMATAMANGLTSKQLMYAMRAHPTFNEGISCAVENSWEK